MYCMVSSVFCIIHSNFKISIIDEKQGKKWEEMKELSENVFEKNKNNDATVGKCKTATNFSLE